MIFYCTGETQQPIKLLCISSWQLQHHYAVSDNLTVNTHKSLQSILIWQKATKVVRNWLVWTKGPAMECTTELKYSLLFYLTQENKKSYCQPCTVSQIQHIVQVRFTLDTHTVLQIPHFHSKLNVILIPTSSSGSQIIVLHLIFFYCCTCTRHQKH